MAEAGTQGGGANDLFALFGGNPLTAISRNVENFRAAVDGSLAALANLNRTMESLDLVARRVLTLLDDIEEPIRTVVPQLTKVTAQSVKLFEQISGPLDRVAPGLEQLADTLSSPMFSGMPNVLGDFLDTLRDLAARLRPLGQVAEAAGAMFGMRAMPGFRMPGTPAPAPAAPAAPAPVAKEPAKKPATKVASSSAKKKSPAKKKAPAKKKPAAKKARTATASDASS